MKGSFLGRLYKNRFQSEGELRQVLEAEAAAERQRSASTSCVGKRYHYIRGIYKGNFFRIKAPESTGILSRRIPRLRNHANPAMRPFLHPEQVKGHAKTPPGVTADALVSQTEMAAGGYWERVRWWWKHNWAVLVLNLGSVCSLLAFTRSDVLELRSLSVTGTVSALIYNLALPAEQRSLTPILWSLTFLGVNGFKIYEILVERRAVVELPKQHEDIYRLYFQPHGVTPKQFEYIMRRARTIRLNKGEVLVREGALLTRVFLVTEGCTRAHHLGRRLTAVSFTPEFHAVQQGGASGAWIGEMAYLEHYRNKDHPQSNENDKQGSSFFQSRQRTQNPCMRAMYTISAVKDNTTILAWKHTEMDALLGKSSDLRSALTRAMSAAIIGKVINFTASRKAADSARPSSWLGGIRPPPPQTHKTVPPITWMDELDEEDEEDQPVKVKVTRKPTFALPED